VDYCSYFNGYQEVFFKGEILFSEPYPKGGNERRELYRLPNGNYLSGIRFRDLGDVLTKVEISETCPEGFQREISQPLQKQDADFPRSDNHS
jgi:hypothetical protein